MTGSNGRVVIFLAALLAAAPGRGALFTVTRFDDQPDTSPGDAACVAQNGGGCSLRAALQEANALFGPDSIYLPPGTYGLTRAGAGEDLASTGDLDVLSAVTVVGTGWSVTTVQMTDFGDRVFDVHGFSSLELADLTVRGGSIDGRGGGLRVRVGGSLAVRRSRIAGCLARHGGGVASDGGPVVIEDSELRDNFSVSDVPSSYADAGALSADSADIVLRRSSVHDNWRDSDRASILVIGSSLQIESSTVIDSQNNSYAITAVDSELTITSSTIGFLQLSETASGTSSLSLGCSLVEVCGVSGGAVTSFGKNVFLNGVSCVGVDDTNGDWNLEPLMAPPGKFPARVPNRYSAAVDGGHAFVCAAEDQWGQPRPHDDDGDGVAVIDVGAIEASLIFTDGFESGNTVAW